MRFRWHTTIRSGVLLAVLACLAAPGARAAAPPALSRARASQLIARAYHRPVNVIGLFPGPDGLIGAIVAGRPAGREIVWLTPHGEALFAMGALRDAEGRDLARAALREHGIPLSPAAVLAYARDPGRQAIPIGRGGPSIVVLFDPGSADCQLLYRALAPAVASGQVRVRYVLVGGNTPGSLPRAASILAAADPARALDRNERAYDTIRQEGGFPAATGAASAFTRAVMDNDALLASAGGIRTPATYYCSRASHKALVMFGVPRDLQAFLMQADPSGQSCGE